MAEQRAPSARINSNPYAGTSAASTAHLVNSYVRLFTLAAQAQRTHPHEPSPDTGHACFHLAPPPPPPTDNRKKALNRQEWLQVIVRGAIMRYVLPGDVTDVAIAVERLFVEVLEPKFDPLLLAPPDDFRKVIYVLEVCRVMP